MTELPQEDEPLTFSNRPVKMRCPFCLQQTTSELVLKPQWTTIIVGLLAVLLLPGYINILALVLAFQLLSVTKHRCAMCERQLGTDGKFLHCLQDDVYSFNIGRTGVILSKKIVINLLLTALLATVLFIKAHNRYGGHSYIDTKWEQFNQHCSQAAMESHSVALQCHFNYEGKTVRNWQGYILRLKDNRNNLYRFLEYHVCLYVKLEPQLGDRQVDVMLTMDSWSVAEYEQQLDNLHHGDEILFNATFFSVAGRTGDALPHLHITHLNVTGQKNPSLPYYILKSEQLANQGNLQKHP